MRYFILAFCLLGISEFLGCAAHQRTEPALVPISRDNSLQPVLVCTPQRSVIRPGEKVALRAWAEEDIYPDLAYYWQSEVGHITPNGHQALWDLTGVNAGVYRASVRVQASEEIQASCSMTIVVKSVRAVTGRSFLVRNHKEVKDYGLYSYLLFGSKAANETSRKRNLEVIRAYLSLDTIDDLEEVFSRQELNTTYLPLKIEPKEPVSADWLLKHYDYPRAKLLLSVVPGNHMDGPYLVSSLVPLTDTLHLTGHYLVQDLSWVPEDSDILGLWIREFRLLASQERFWEETTARQLMLKMRTLIRVAAHGFPEVKAAVDQWISWITE